MQDDDAVRQKLGCPLIPLCRNRVPQGIERVAEAGSRDEASEGGRRNEQLHDQSNTQTIPTKASREIVE